MPGLLALFPFAQASAQCELFKRTDALAPVPIGTFDLEDYGSALDLDGDRLAIGSRGTFAQGGRPGFVEVLDRDGVNWVPLGRWDSVDLDPNFGGQVAVGGDVLAVSQTDDVLVYEFVSGVWVETARLLSENGLQGNGGGELAVDGDRILVGAINAKPFARVYVFERTVGAWTLADTLISSGGRAGWSVDLEGDRALVGAPFQNVPGGQGAGAAYVFEFDGVDWVEVERLTASDPTIDARFGLAVALAGERAVIGAPFSNRAIFHGGAAYFFERDSGGDWSEAWAHTPSDTSSSALFGVAVDLHGTLAAVGATLQDSFPGAREGLVSVFEEQSGAWGELTTLLPSDASPGDQFGVQVVTDGELVIATAEWEDEEGPNFGAVYGFSVTGAICPTLQSFPRRISLSAGGVQTLLLRAGAAHAGRTYLMAGSLSGTDPGFRLRGTYVPLNPDSYFGFSLRQANQGPFAATLGTLDGAGRATASVTIPPGSALVLAGLRLNHAYVVFEGALAGALRHVSNPALVRLDP